MLLKKKMLSLVKGTIESTVENVCRRRIKANSDCVAQTRALVPTKKKTEKSVSLIYTYSIKSHYQQHFFF